MDITGECHRSENLSGVSSRSSDPHLTPHLAGDSARGGRGAPFATPPPRGSDARRRRSLPAGGGGRTGARGHRRAAGAASSARPPAAGPHRALPPARW
eukprot:643132-Prorocentrum_minimum.AAC.1